MSSRYFDFGVAFARAMHAAGEFEDPGLVIDYFEAPWKWERELTLWKELGRPRAPDEEGWETFADLLARGQGAVREYLFERL